MILAFYELSKVNANLQLHIAGGPREAHGDYYSALHRVVKELELTERVTFYGNVADAWNWYTKIDIFISNSYSEGLQVAPMEAMATGCYCLSHWWDGADELLPEENLFYTDKDLQKKILSYCAATEVQRQQQRVHMRNLACENFNIKNTKLEIRRIVEEVAESWSLEEGTSE